MTPIRKQVIPTLNRHSTFRKERIADVKREATIGRYSKLLSKKNPRNFKKMKAPFEVYKDETIKKVINHLINLYKGKMDKIVDNGNATKQSFFLSFSNLRNELAHKNIDIFNNDGSDLHLILPLAGMSSVGYFYKAIFERLLPKARVTFLKTYSKEFNSASNVDLIELRKSINKNDKLFVMIDFISPKERTKTIVSENLLQLNNNFKLIAINSQESDIYGIADIREEIKDRFKPKSTISLHRVDSLRTMHKYSDNYLTLDGKRVYTNVPEAYKKKYNKGKILIMNGEEQEANKSKFNYLNTSYRTIPNSEKYKLYSSMNDYNPKLYNFLKRLNQAKAYTYYYLGYEFINEIIEKQKK